MFVNFLGMFGPNGPLPQQLTDFARDRLRNAHDPTLVRFMDIFHHECCRSFIVLGQAIRRALISIAGPCALCRLFWKPFRHWNPVIPGSGLGVGLDKDPFCRPPVGADRNAEGLEAILADYFGIPTEIREFEGYWMKIPAENQCRLGESPETGSLGINAVVGERKYEVQLKFRVRMGPMELADLQRLVPIGHSFERLKDWVLNYVNREGVLGISNAS